MLFARYTLPPNTYIESYLSNKIIGGVFEKLFKSWRWSPHEWDHEWEVSPESSPSSFYQVRIHEEVSAMNQKEALIGTMVSHF